MEGVVFDYLRWAVRAADFVRRLASLAGVEVRTAELGPALGAAGVDQLQRVLGRPLPAALRGLLERGSGALDCRYIFEPEPESAEWERFAALFPHQTYVYGGARVLAAELPDLQRSAAEWVRDTWVGEDPGQRALWEGALPFAGVENGDFLALDLRAPALDPPVVYLSHEDEGAVLAPSLSGFLAAWEALCYIGPEIWLLEEFRGRDGYLDGEDAKARELRALLAPGTAAGLRR